MKLLSCHIENFGAIHQADYKFDGALTAICERNGYGKTTLASFLKAMFYGMDSDRANSLFNDRRHFCPFTGGKFGGSVTFEAGGATYKIERFFDAKSEPKDTIVVYRNNTPVPCGGAPGQEFFGIDKESFERTAYISGADVKILSTGNIHQKLNHFVEGDQSDLDYEAAKARLQAKIKTYQKTRGGGGSISDATRRLNDLSAQISDKRAIEENLPQKYAELCTRNEEIAALTLRITAAQSENVLLANWESYDHMCAEIAKERQQLGAIEEQFPFGIPSLRETEQVQNALEHRKTDSALLSQKSFGSADESRFSALHQKYADGVSDDSLADIRKKIEAEKRSGFRLNAQPAPPSDRESLLMQKFAYRTPTEKEVADVEAKAERYKSAEKACGEIPAFTAAPAAPTTPKPNSKPLLLAAVVAVVLMIAGIATMFFQMLAGIAALAVGIVVLLVAGFLYLNRKTAAPAVQAQAENPEKRKAQDALAALYAELQAALLPYGYSFENGVQYAVMSFVSDVKSYRELCARAEREQIEAEQLGRTRRELQESIEAFFAKYAIAAESYDARLTTLQSELDEYKKLKLRREEWAKQESRLRSSIDDRSETIRAFCQTYKIGADGISEALPLIMQNIADHARLQRDLAEKERRAETFRTEKQLSERPGAAATDLGELNGRLSDLQNARAKCLKQISEDEAEVEALDGLQSEYEETRARLSKERADYSTLCKTLELLEQADQALKDRYIKPVKDRFLRYSASLEKAIGERIAINADFEVRYESEGAEHSDEHLSTGQRCLCALCFRLALLDNMYPDEKPFVILDDPFMSLDEAHLSKAKTLLRDIAGQIQLIYFTCHPSRTL